MTKHIYIRNKSQHTIYIQITGSKYDKLKLVNPESAAAHTNLDDNSLVEDQYKLLRQVTARRMKSINESIDPHHDNDDRLLTSVFKKYAIEILPGESKDVYLEYKSSTFLHKIYNLFNTNILSLAVMYGDCASFVFFKSEVHYSWIATSSRVVRAVWDTVRDTVSKEDPEAGYHRLIPPPQGKYLGSVLKSGDRMAPLDYLMSPDMRYFLPLQKDGNFVLYKDGIAIWATFTDNKIITEALMQEDGNFVMYAKPNRGDPVWSTDTYSDFDRGSYLELQDDGKIVLYTKDDRKSIWSVP
ncbi:MAG: hypothetical protein HRT38_15755 [Alteromonadaceae bacterium]|nr:hypothetical protein [Alteromonadaceae bacterium]